MEGQVHMKRIYTKSFALFLALLVMVTMVSAGGSAICAITADSCKTVQKQSCCIDDKMGQHETGQPCHNQTDAGCSDNGSCWHDCDSDSIVATSFLQQQEKEYSLIPPHQFISSVITLNHFPSAPGLPPPVSQSIQLHIFHCVYLI
jgi:hypothetical protein